MDKAKKTESTGSSSNALTVKLLLHSVSIVLITAVAILAIGAWLGLAWFLSNDRVSSGGISISAKSQPSILLATVGNKASGTHDSLFGLFGSQRKETIGGVDYYIAEGCSSLRVSSDKNLNNYLDNADLRPGNRASFANYVIDRTSSRQVTLQPVLSPWYETKDEQDDVIYEDACAPEAPSDVRVAANYLKGHLLLFANMDSRGMYMGCLDMTQPFTVHLDKDGSRVSQGSHEFLWNTEEVYADETTAVYRLPVYWVWPEQFGNFIYTGNAYTKTLFAAENADYERLCGAMKTDCRRFFNTDTPLVVTDITVPRDYQTATRKYEDYSNYYNEADEAIGEHIAYVEIGFSCQLDENRGLAE